MASKCLVLPGRPWELYAWNRPGPTRSQRQVISFLEGGEILMARRSSSHDPWLGFREAMATFFPASARSSKIFRTSLNGSAYLPKRSMVPTWGMKVKGDMASLSQSKGHRVKSRSKTGR